MMVRTRRERERLRQSFRPPRIQLLFIGESPPASGRFFYSGNSGLYRAMRAAFQSADAKVNDENFLAVFRARGCYLTDLSHEPIDHLDPPQRRAMRSNGEKFLAREITRLQPGIIAPLLRSIAGNVENAAARANWQGQILQFPYPGRWSRYREAFIKALVPVIRRLRIEDGAALSSPGSR
jgi:uracil DNA glycosylase superfamily protein